MTKETLLIIRRHILGMLKVVENEIENLKLVEEEIDKLESGIYYSRNYSKDIKIRREQILKDLQSGCKIYLEERLDKDKT